MSAMLGYRWICSVCLDLLWCQYCGGDFKIGWLECGENASASEFKFWESPERKSKDEGAQWV